LRLVISQGGNPGCVHGGRDGVFFLLPVEADRHDTGFNRGLDVIGHTGASCCRVPFSIVAYLSALRAVADKHAILALDVCRLCQHVRDGLISLLLDLAGEDPVMRGCPISVKTCW
jgi:hypothetical protein